ncbi:MAG: hypothetical protein BIFFINMI_00358 [Phycisphaerae bacterium]|nr:hypothetical protein [Phycisphaerae bacterium]
MSRTRSVVLSLSALVLLATVSASAEVRIPLTIQETGGCGRAGLPITSGVPLLPGQCSDLNKLALLDAKGNVVPCQFRPLARWWRGDNSIRWVLLDFKADVPSYGLATYTLTDSGAKPAAASPLKVQVADDRITVNTGPAEFTISRKKFNLFEQVRLDANNDGQFTDDEAILVPGVDSGSVVTDTFGTKYLSGEGTTDVHVEEAGPQRVRIVAKGTHRARDGKGYGLGMYGFEIRMDFFAGLNTVRLDALITNNGPQPNGSPTFEDCSLITQLKIGHSGRVAKIYGVAPVDVSVADNQSALLYQDSVGSENWKINPGLEGPNVRDLSSFRGYKIIHRADGKENEVAQGDHARGLVEFGDKNVGVVIVPRHFWELFPKAVEVSGDGTVRVSLFPAEYKGVHWIEDASASGQEIWLHFYSTAQKPQYAADPLKRPWPHVIDDMMVTPTLFARCAPAHYAACGALADLGPYLTIGGQDDVTLENEPVHTVTGDFPLPVTERRYFMTDYLKGNAFGWQVFGCRWEEYAGHSPWNYEPIGSSYFLFNYVNTGGPNFLEYGLRRFRHFRDLRAYKIDGTDLWDYKDWKGYSGNNVAEEWCSRKGLEPKGDEIAKYSAGRYARRGWFGPNPEHANLDELNDLYLLFGDERAREGMANIASYGGALVGLRKVDIGRHTGWALRALVRYYELTGDKEALKYLNPALDNFWDVARRNRSVQMIKYDNNWFMDVFSRAAVMAYDLTGDERIRDLVIGLDRDRHKSKGAWPTMTAFCWDQTGLEEYYSEQAASYARLGGYFPACAGYLWAKPRPDKAAPAAVADLAAAAGAGEVTLTWTAPGDDANAGTAALYQVKYDDLPLVETADGSKKNVNFWAAINCTGEPTPAKAGTKQTFTVKGLKPGTYYFALKARDECNNESPISNVAKAEVK